MTDLYDEEIVKTVTEAFSASYYNGTIADSFEPDARAILDAVAPHIAAKALRDAADRLEANRTKKNPPLGQVPGSVLCGPAYLQYRADEIEGSK